MLSMKKPLLRPKSVPIAWLLLGGVGALVTVSLAIVLATGFLAAGRNTVELIRDRVTDVMDVMVSRIDSHLQPAEIHSRLVAEMIVSESFDFRSSDIDRIRLTMAATPQIRGLAVVLADGRTIRVGRDGLVARGDWSEIGMTQEFYDRVVGFDGVSWRDPVWAADVGHSIVIANYPIRDGDRVLGFVATALTTDDLSVFLNQISTPTVRAFLLDSDNHMIAHHEPRSSAQDWTRDHLPTPAEIGDTVLDAFVNGRYEETSLLQDLEGLKTAIVHHDGGDSVIITSILPAVLPLQWTLGVIASTDEADVLFERLYAILFAGGAVLGLTLLLLWRIARSVRRPVAALAAAANQIRRLELDDIAEPPDTNVAELRDASAAFHSMISALRWFETYVPRRLVKRLMEASSDDGIPTRNRKLTVMFTDIPGFTTLSENKDAREVAQLLNDHFSLIARCVEAEDGTIDKYIGDSVMAFWGAPSRQEDHAARGIRAAMAIAEAIRLENEVRAGAGEPTVGVRVGLHSGTVIVGNIGAPGRINYTVVGDPVNIANRIEQLGKEVDPSARVIVLASGDTVESAGESGVGDGAISVGSRTLRGLSQPIEIWRLV